MQIKLSSIAWIGALAFMAGPEAANSQPSLAGNPEAKAFLESFAPGGGFELQTGRPSSPNLILARGVFETNNACHIGFSYRTGSGAVGLIGTTERVMKFEYFEEVRLDGTKVTIVGGGRRESGETTNPSTVLIFSHPNVAARFAYAAEVFRLACDPTDGYGF